MKACSIVDVLRVKVGGRAPGAPFWSMLRSPPIPGKGADTPAECESKAATFQVGPQVRRPSHRPPGPGRWELESTREFLGWSAHPVILCGVCAGAALPPCKAEAGLQHSKGWGSPRARGFVRPPREANWAQGNLSGWQKRSPSKKNINPADSNRMPLKRGHTLPSRRAYPSFCHCGSDCSWGHFRGNLGRLS